MPKGCRPFSSARKLLSVLLQGLGCVYISDVINKLISKTQYKIGTGSLPCRQSYISSILLLKCLKEKVNLSFVFRLKNVFSAATVVCNRCRWKWQQSWWHWDVASRRRQRDYKEPGPTLAAYDLELWKTKRPFDSKQTEMARNDVKQEKKLLKIV